MQSTQPVIDLGTRAERYEVRRPEQVRHFLAEHPVLRPLLDAAPEQIDADFGDGTRLRLEMTTDPEHPDDAALFVVILAAEDLDTARKRLRRLDDGWWRSVHRQTHGRLALDVEPADGV